MAVANVVLGSGESFEIELSDELAVSAQEYLSILSEYRDASAAHAAAAAVAAAADERLTAVKNRLGALTATFGV